MTTAPVIYCIDIGGTRTKYGLINSVSGEIKVFRVEATESRGLPEFVEAADRNFDDLCAEARIDRQQVSACGVGIPGFVDGSFISRVWPTLAFIEGTTFQDAMEARLRISLRMDNDARVVALGEAAYGRHGRPQRLLSLTLGTGLGFGLVVDGQLQEKSSINHLAGHIPIRPGARPCFCGFSGCLEALVNASSLEERFGALTEPHSELDHVDAREIFTLAAQNHPAARQAVDALVDDLVQGLNAYIHLFAPEVIVLGGGLAQPLGPWLDEIQRGLFAMPFDGYTVRVRLSELREYAGLYGAASLWQPPISSREEGQSGSVMLSIRRTFPIRTASDTSAGESTMPPNSRSVAASATDT